MGTFGIIFWILVLAVSIVALASKKKSDWIAEFTPKPPKPKKTKKGSGSFFDYPSVVRQGLGSPF